MGKMKRFKRILAGVMSAFLLLTNFPADISAVEAAEEDAPMATATDSAETDEKDMVAIYKGGLYSFGEHHSNWYSTTGYADSTNVDAYSIASGYEMSGESLTANAESVTDSRLIKALYYSYGAPGYRNNQTAMEELFLSCHAVTPEERAGISYLLISGYAEYIYNFEEPIQETGEEEAALDNLRTGIEQLPVPADNFRVYVVDDTETNNSYDLIFWRESETEPTEAEADELQELTEAELQTVAVDTPQTIAAGTISTNSYWAGMKNWIQNNGMLISGASGYGENGYNGTSDWSCAGWVSRVIYYALGETGVANAYTPRVPNLQDEFLEPSGKFQRIHNMIGSGTAGAGCISYGSVSEAVSIAQSNFSSSTAAKNSAKNAEDQFIALVNSGSIKAGDIIIFYEKNLGSGRSHAAIMGDTWTGSTPNIYNALNSRVGSTSDTPVSWLFTQTSSDEKSAIGFAIYRYQSDGYAYVQKGSVDSKTEENPDYSYAGIVYGIYTKEGEQYVPVVSDLTLDEQGRSRTVKLTIGTQYYLHEISVPENCGYTLDPGYYDFGVLDSNTETNPKRLFRADTPILGSMSLSKESGQADITDTANHRTYYDLSGAVYQVTDVSGKTVGLFVTDSDGIGKVAASAKDASGKTVTASLKNASDVGTTKLTGLYLGSYRVSEIKAPTDGSYKINTSYADIKVTTDDKNAVINETDYIETAKVQVTKVSSNPVLVEGNACYSLAGALYTIYEADGKTVAQYVTEKDADGKISGTAKAENLVTDVNGNLPLLELPFGTYYVKEVQASKGYQVDTCNEGTVASMHKVTLNKKDQIYTVTCEEVPVSDPINIRLVKWDEETDRASALGGASLEHAYFTVKYYAGVYEKNNLPNKPTRTWVIQTLYDDTTGVYRAVLDDGYKVSGDALYYLDDIVVLPLGTVIVEETTAPEGYKLVTDGGMLWDANGSVEDGMFYGQVKENSTVLSGASLYVGDKIQGEIITGNPLTTTAISIYEPIVRTDMSFSKLDYATRDEMAGIPFKITSKTTGESHIVVTDEKGYFSTNVSHRKHTDNTNANDRYLTQELTSYDDCVECGVWFYGTADQGEWNEENMDDAKGALPYDTYIIEELPCAKNKGKQLEMTIEVVTDAEDDGKVINVGILTNLPEPTISTSAWDTETESHFSLADESVTIIDTVSYQWLTAGKTYTVKGVLMDKEASKNEKGAKPLLDADGNPITASATFTIPKDYQVNEKEKCGSVEVTYQFDGSNLAGKSYVIFEYLFEGESDTPLYKEGELNLSGAVKNRAGEVVRHADVKDEKQSGSFPRIDTAAWEQETNVNVSAADDSVRIHDMVTYSGLIPTYEYKLVGTLMDKNTGKEILDKSGNPVTKTVHFVAQDEKGEVEIIFDSIDATGMDGDATVVYERLYWNNREYASHVNLDDESQSVFYPVIHTLAKDSETEEDRACADDSVTIVDTVLYENLMPGILYKVSGELVDKKTGKPVKTSDGKPVTADTTFTPEDFSGSVDVTFTFNALDADLAGKTVVCYETLSVNNVVLTEHKDLKDEGQTIYFPSVRTSLLDADTGIQNSYLDEEIVLTDTVAYTNLLVGKTYKVSGTLMDKKTGKSVSVGGTPVKAEATFTAEASDGTVDVTFTFDGVAAGLTGNSYLVAFEKLYYVKADKGGTKDILVGFHEDIDDVDQTVSIPDIQTTLLDHKTDDHIAKADEKVTLVDHVAYKGLIPGKQYTVSGTLMLETENGKSEKLLVDGKPVTASTTFTPEKADGSVDVVFTVNASALAGEHVVAFEDCTYNDKKVAVHADIHDNDQRVDFPDIHTMAVDSETNDHIALADNDVTIIDTVSYENLLVGKQYVIKGILMNKKTGEPVLDADGNQVTAAGEFETKAPKENPEALTVSGTAEIVFRFRADQYVLEGLETVVYEELYYKDEVVAEHKDLTDENQTVYLPGIKTSLRDVDTGIQNTFLDDEIVLVDTVNYTSLLAGERYRIVGTLMDKETGECVCVDGKPVTAETSFVAEASDGTVDVTFTFDGIAAGLHGNCSLVAFERLYLVKTAGTAIAEYPVGIHEDIGDVDQTVSIPDIQTTLLDERTEDHMAKAEKEVKLVDHVAYKGLIPGKRYTISGTLMTENENKEAEPLLVNGMKVTVSTSFIPEEPDGVVDIIFTVDASALAGEHVVAFEECTYHDKKVAVHADIHDEDQRVDFPDIHTMAVDSETNDHIALADDDVTIIDTVSYENLPVDRTYTVRGVLMNKETGTPVTDAEGNMVTAETEFDTYLPKIGTAVEIDENGTETESENSDALTTSGTVLVEFHFDATGFTLEGFETVVFEELYYKDKVIAEHKDLADEGQTITFGKAETTAKDSETGTHTSTADKEATIIDTVSYSGLLAGKEYTVSGVLMDKKTGEVLLVDGKEIRAEKVFTAEKPDGEIELSFIFPASALSGKTVVVFETVYFEEKEVAVHADINDKDQSIYFPEIKTNARDQADGDRKLAIKGTVTVVDKVTYSSLEAGESYIVEGILMDKSTGKPLLVNGKELKANKTFVPEETDGFVELSFTFDVSGLQGREIVVFEKLYLEASGTLVAGHEDINDKNQTVKVTDEHYPKTGDHAPLVLLFIICGCSLLAGCLIFLHKRHELKEILNRKIAWLRMRDK